MKAFRSLLLLYVVSLIIRLLFAAYADTSNGMSEHYVGLSDMLASGYGYNRIAYDPERGDTWREFLRELRAHAVALDSRGEALSSANTLPLAGQELTPEFYRTPGYPVFLRGVGAVFGEPLELWVQILQSLLGALVPLLVFAVARELSLEASSAMACAWVAAIYPPLAYISASILPQVPPVLLLMAALWAAARSARLGQPWMAGAAGLLLGFSGLFRPNSMFLWLFLCIVIALTPGAFAHARRGKTLVSMVVLIIGSYAILTPWGLRNYELTGDFTLGSSTTGTTLWKAAGRYPNKWGLISLDEAATEYARANGFESDYTPAANKWFMAEMRGYMEEDPGFFVKAAIQRFPLVAAPAFSFGYVNPNRTKGITEHFANEEGLSPIQVVLRHPGYVVSAFWERLLVMGVGLLGTFALAWVLFTRFRKDRRLVVFLLAIPAYFVAVHTLTISQPRYMIPIIPFHLIAIAILFQDIAAWLRRRGRINPATRAG